MAASEVPPWAARGFRHLILTTIVALVAQYFLGLWTNTYGGFSPTHAPAPLMAHIALGYLLLVLAILAVVFASLNRHTGSIVASLALLASILVAAIAGSQFLNDASQPPADSFAMGTAFLAALLSALALAYLQGFRPMVYPTGSPPP